MTTQGLLSEVVAPSRGVQEGAELRRILALPRRDWESSAPGLTAQVSDYVRAPGGTQVLRPVQVAVLCDLHDYGGCLAPVRVGGGKTLVSLLAPVVVGAKRPMLLVPAKLVEKTRHELATYRKHWLLPGYVRIVSYELLGRQQSATLLEEYAPDLIVADEAHKLKNTAAAVTRRVKRYMDAHPDTKLLAMSGTVTKRSILDYVHIASWALRGSNPTPRDFVSRQEWSSVIDEKPRTKERLSPGALEQLCESDEERQEFGEDPVRAVRRAYRRRLVQTPGVVATQEGALGMSLVIDSEVIAVPGAVPHVERLRREWVRPDGEEVIDAIEMWRHLKELAQGFWYKWDPAPPREWLEARRAWGRAVREVLKNNRRGLDSESQVMAAVQTTEDYLQHKPTLEAWLAIRPSYTPRTVAEWVDDTVIKRAVRWMISERGIVWVEHREFGERLSLVTKVPYYSRGGLDASGRSILQHPKGYPMICSIAANAEGRNLQAWSSNLIVSPPSSGATWEQLLGRTHRDGQEEDEVTATLLLALREQGRSFERARNDARYITDTTGQEQKLTYADVTVTPAADLPTLPNGVVTSSSTSNGEE